MVLCAIALVLAMSLPAFRAFFLGEDFVYLAQLQHHNGDVWGAVNSATDRIFYRPLFAAVNLVWMAVLPLDPVAHHIRNLVFSGIDIGLMWVLMGSIGLARLPRVVPTLFFALSKVHMTTIGYINVYDSILSVMLLLLTAIFCFRFANTRSRLDRVLALGFASLSIFTKDYGVVVIAVVAAIWLLGPSVHERAVVRAQRVLYDVAPLFGVAALYFWLRLHAVAPPTGNAVYSPEVSFLELGRKMSAFVEILGNFSTPPFDPDALGAPGIVGFLGLRLFGQQGIYLEFIGLAVFIGLIGWTLVARRNLRGPVVVALVWIGVYLGPTVLTRNLQMYYFYEPLAGATVLLALCLAGAPRRLATVWMATLLLLAANGFFSNYASLYAWQFAADLTGEIRAPVVEAHHNEPIDSITFVTANEPFWQWGLDANGNATMLQALMHRPKLTIGFVGYDELQPLLTRADDRHLVFDVDNGFIERNKGVAIADLSIATVSPSRTKPGVRFNVQPNGESAISLSVAGATRATTVVMGGRRLVTAYGGPTLVTAFVPDDLIEREGLVPIYITNGVATSPSVTFVVSSDDAALPPFSLKAVSPTGTTTGHGFAVQPDGSSAISVTCDNAALGTIVVFDGHELQTAFGDSTWLTATVPPELFARPGSYDVLLRQGGRESNKLTFVVSP